MQQMTLAGTPRKRAPGGGRKAGPGGRRNKRAETTLNAPERERHEAWLTSKGWPERPESEIVREALAELWASVPQQRTAA